MRFEIRVYKNHGPPAAIVEKAATRIGQRQVHTGRGDRAFVSMEPR
jgi:hypothetical protein